MDTYNVNIFVEIAWPFFKDVFIWLLWEVWYLCSPLLKWSSFDFPEKFREIYNFAFGWAKEKVCVFHACRFWLVLFLDHAYLSNLIGKTRKNPLIFLMGANLEWKHVECALKETIGLSHSGWAVTFPLPPQLSPGFELEWVNEILWYPFTVQSPSPSYLLAKRKMHVL